MAYIIKFLRLFVLLGCIFSAASIRAADSDELTSLENEMLKLINGNDREAFTRVAENLKTASLKEGDERMFYKAWGYQAIYEATNQYLQKAHEITQEITAYAQKEGSVYGQYMALHSDAMVLLQTLDYDAQEKAFLRAIEFRRRHLPNESGIEDLRELFKIAYDRGDLAKAQEIAYQVLDAPNVTPRYKSRILSRLCALVFRRNNVEEYNRLYSEINRLSKIDNGITIHPYTELNYHIINRDYEQALMLVDSLSADTCAERKAIIYERLGDYEKAYSYMMLYKQISDSISRASHNKELSNLLLRMNNNRMRMEGELLEKENSYLQYRFYVAVAIICIMILLFIAYQRYKYVRKLEQNYTMLRDEKDDAETALKTLNELSLYEEMKELPLDMLVNINNLCNKLASIAQKHCRKGVITIFQTELPDGFKLSTNPEALENLLTHLLNYSLHITEEGFILLKCSGTEKCVRISITHTDHGANNQADEDNSERSAQQSFVGLNVCQSISRLLHGRIWRDTEYTDGTRYIFEIQKTATDILMEYRLLNDADYGRA